MTHCCTAPQARTSTGTLTLKTARHFRRAARQLLLLCLILAGWNIPVCRADSAPLKAAFLFSGPVGDAGWNYGHEMARLKLAAKFPDIETVAVTSVSAEDAGKIMENQIQHGTRAIFATSVNFSSAVRHLAGKYPDTTFFLCEGTLQGPNVITYSGKIYQPAYLCGVLAAKMTTKRHIGFLGETVNPVTLSMLNAFVRGAQAVDPGITVTTGWTGTADAPDQACRLLGDLIDQGIDIYFNGIHSAQPMQVAMDRGIFVIGFGTDLSSFASPQLLTSAVFDWSFFYERFIRDLQQDSISPGHLCKGLKSGATRLGQLSPIVPAMLEADIRKRENDIRNGRINVFAGPLYDTSGKLRIGKDKNLSQQQLQSMDWLLRGIKGLPPATRTEQSFKVFIVQSYENGHVCGVSQEKGIRTALRENLGENIEIRTHYMDTKTGNNSPALMQAEATRVLHSIKKFNPDLVFTLDDNAFREVGLKLAGKPYPVIFSGVNGQPQDYNRNVPFLDAKGQPNLNITGVYEKLHVQTAMNVMHEVLPELRHMVALLDGTPTGKAISKQLQREMVGGNSSVKLAIRTVTTLADYHREIERINADPEVQAVYPVVLCVKNRQGRSIGFRDTIRIFLKHCRKPGIPINFAFAKQGLFGGASVDFEAMGKQAGNMGVQLLQDKNIRYIPIESAQKAVIAFNTTRARMLGIDIPQHILASAEVFTNTILDNSQPSDNASGE